MNSAAYTNGAAHTADGVGTDLKRKSSFIDFVQPTRTSLILTTEDRPGALVDLLSYFSKNSISLSHIESRTSRQNPGHYDFFVDVPGEDAAVLALVPGLKEMCKSVVVLGTEKETPWFPRKISDLDRFADRTLEMGEELSCDHPGAKDAEYRKRRYQITQNAREFRFGDRIPDVEYTQAEIETWGVVFRRLTALYPTHACAEFNRLFPLLEKYCSYNDKSIPQLQTISDFMHSQTGFRLRPVAGLLSSRDFLNGLAFRVFHSTQYIRHHSVPLYTPEPDVCHELLGHVPLFADPEFADFSQEIGLLSLGVSDADIEKLATCYWFTIEFGLCRQGSELKAYGAGLLSSFGELEYCLSGKPETRPFNPAVTALTAFPITEYQPIYFVAESFEDAKQKLRAFGRTLTRQFAVRYNPYTESVEVINSHGEVNRIAHQLKSDMDVLVNAMDVLSAKDN